MNISPNSAGISQDLRIINIWLLLRAFTTAVGSTVTMHNGSCDKVKQINKSIKLNIFPFPYAQLEQDLCLSAPLSFNLCVIEVGHWT